MTPRGAENVRRGRRHERVSTVVEDLGERGQSSACALGAEMASALLRAELERRAAPYVEDDQ